MKDQFTRDALGLLGVALIVLSVAPLLAVPSLWTALFFAGVVAAVLVTWIVGLRPPRES